MELGHPWILVPLAGSETNPPCRYQGTTVYFPCWCMGVKRISLSLMNFIEVSLASLPNERTLPLTV